MNATPDLFFGVAIFLAAAVEAIEALTIVLAVAIVRGWRSVTYAIIAGVLTLTVIVAAVGYALLLVPLHAVWLFGGGILLIFGLQWVHKAILRYMGLKPTRDELEVYDRERRNAKRQKGEREGIDWYAFVIVYKTIIIEGLEVIFIVLAFGALYDNLLFGASISVAAILLVSGLGVFIHKPLSKFPENSMKFAVGILLVSFGTVFAATGAGIIWPNEYVAFALLVPTYLGVSILSMYLLEDPRKGIAPPDRTLLRNMIITATVFVVIAIGLYAAFRNNPLPTEDLSFVTGNAGYIG